MSQSVQPLQDSFVQSVVLEGRTYTNLNQANDDFNHALRLIGLERENLEYAVISKALCRADQKNLEKALILLSDVMKGTDRLLSPSEFTNVKDGNCTAASDIDFYPLSMHLRQLIRDKLVELKPAVPFELPTKAHSIS